ncbi:MAG TPA: O-antigen ligase family protein [Gaiellaceae bacterium]|nr:O-antigen ligase family protein [Gaiellaceae bacterium]
MSAVAVGAARAVSRVETRVLDVLLFGVCFTATFEKVHWDLAGQVGIADVLTILFLVAYVLIERRPLPRTSAIVMAFFAAFLLVYLAGWFDVETKQGLDQFVKGMVKFLIHFLFLAAAIGYLARRGQRFYWRALGWFTAGFVANALYGILQLVAARGGVNLDHAVLAPLTGGASSINIYGAVNGQNIYRPNALTGDPNHLGVMLDVPLLALTPVYLRLQRGHRLRWPLAAVLAFLLLVELATLSRSGLLGLGVGVLVLALPYRRFVRSRALLVPLIGLALVLLYVVYRQRHFFSVVLRSRLQTGGRSTSAHFAVYDFIPQVLHMHPLLGLGLNNFSVYYEFVTGKSNFGAHSYWVAVVVESGLLGLLVWVVFMRYLFVRLVAARRLGRLLDRLGDGTGARVRPLAWGMTAALAGTIAANFFYLTMQFYYFYAFAAFLLALPVVFARGPAQSSSA